MTIDVAGAQAWIYAAFGIYVLALLAFAAWEEYTTGGPAAFARKLRNESGLAALETKFALKAAADLAEARAGRPGPNADR